MLSAELVCRLVSTPARPCTRPAATISTFASSSVPIVQDARLLGKPQQRGGTGQQAAPPSYRWTNKAGPSARWSRWRLSASLPALGARAKVASEGRRRPRVMLGSTSPASVAATRSARWRRHIEQFRIAPRAGKAGLFVRAAWKREMKSGAPGSRGQPAQHGAGGASTNFGLIALRPSGQVSWLKSIFCSVIFSVCAQRLRLQKSS